MEKRTIDNLGACHRCMHGRGRTASSCPVSALPVTLHAHRGDCPEGRHAEGVSLGTVPADWQPGDHRKDSGGSEGCNC